MRLSTLTVTAFASLALALPSSVGSVSPREDKACMTREEATEIVEIYKRLIANYTPEDAEKYCASDFVDRSDSINTFIHRPLGEATFATKEIFMEAVRHALSGPFSVDDLRDRNLKWCD